MIRIILFALLLVSCSSSQPATRVVDATSTLTTVSSPIQTFTNPPATAYVPGTVLPIDTPSPTLTANPVPCDPFTVDFCITDGHFLLRRPIQPPGEDAVDRTYPYASTADGTRDPHHGVEFEADFGTPVYAAADGTVLFAGADDQPVYSPWRNYYGNLVVIQHNGDIFTLYAHLSKIEVKAGAQVQAGDRLGEVGQSGVAIGSHLHFEVRLGNAEDFSSTANPELWLIVRRADAGGMSITLVNDGRVVPQTAITLQRYPASGQPVETYYFDTYHPSLEFGEENAGIGDLPAGKYRITLIYNGHLYERWVEVQSGKLTQVVIVVE